jgi:asparagine synthase (glutamine-hydrolysing)
MKREDGCGCADQCRCRHLLLTVQGGEVAVLGTPEVRIAQPWPRDPSSSDVWIQWRWNGEMLVVENDRWGFAPVFYAGGPDRIAVATSIPVLLQLGVNRDLDDAALAAFLRLSHFIGDATPFKAIRTLRGGSRMTWRPGTLSVTATEAAPLRPQVLSRTAIVEGYITLFRQAVCRRLPGDDQRVNVPLSGGRDSRHLLFELAHAGQRQIDTVTVRQYPPNGDDDASVAPVVAAAVGVSNVVLPYDPALVAAEHRKNVMTSYCADRHVQMLPLVDYLRDRADVIYQGLGGDTLSGAHLEEQRDSVALLARGRYDELARGLLVRHSDEQALQAVLQPDARRRFSFEAAEADLARELPRHMESPHPWGAFRMANRTARSVALLPFGMLTRACAVMTPYLDADFATFLQSLPTSVLADGQLHDEAIRRAYPRYSDVPYEDRTRPAAHAPEFFRRLSWDLAREMMRRRAPPLVRRRFLASRLLLGTATGVKPWFSVRRTVLLMQLEDLIATG